MEGVKTVLQMIWREGIVQEAKGWWLEWHLGVEGTIVCSLEMVGRRDIPCEDCNKNSFIQV